MNKFNIKIDRLDDAGNLFLARELEYVSAEIYNFKYPAYRLPEIIPISYEVPEGADTITYKMYDKKGYAKVVSNYAKDFPRVDIAMQAITSTVKALGDSYAYTEDELRKAALAKMPLERERAAAAKQCIKQLEEHIALFGDEDFNIQGFLTNPYIPIESAPDDGDGDSTSWDDKTPDQIARDIAQAIWTPFVTSKGIEKANMLLLPDQHYALIANTRMGDGSDTTILKFVQNNNPDVTITYMHQLDHENNDFFDENIMVAYVKDPMHLRFDVPMEFLQNRPREEGLEYVVYCEEKVGGVRMPYPLSACIYEGI